MVPISCKASYIYIFKIEYISIVKIMSRYQLVDVWVFPSFNNSEYFSISRGLHSLFFYISISRNISQFLENLVSKLFGLEYIYFSRSMRSSLFQKHIFFFSFYKNEYFSIYRNIDNYIVLKTDQFQMSKDLIFL